MANFIYKFDISQAQFGSNEQLLEAELHLYKLLPDIVADRRIQSNLSIRDSDSMATLQDYEGDRNKTRNNRQTDDDTQMKCRLKTNLLEVSRYY